MQKKKGKVVRSRRYESLEKIPFPKNRSNLNQRSTACSSSDIGNPKPLMARTMLNKSSCRELSINYNKAARNINNPEAWKFRLYWPFLRFRYFHVFHFYAHVSH